MMPVTRDIYITPRFFPRLTAGDLKRYLDGLPDSAPVEFQVDTTDPIGVECIPGGHDLLIAIRGTPGLHRTTNQTTFDFPEETNEPN